LTNFDSIRTAIFERLNKNTVILIGLFTLIGMGFGSGIYYNSVNSRGEIMDLKNKQTLEMMEIRNKQANEIMDINNKHFLETFELQKKISLLEIKNEKGNKK